MELTKNSTIDSTMTAREIDNSSLVMRNLQQRSLKDILAALGERPVPESENVIDRAAEAVGLEPNLLAVLKQKSSPNKAQTSFISYEYVAILVQPLDKTIRYTCTKSF